MITPITSIVNFLGLVIAVWLGLFLVTRNPRSLIAWLTGLAMWSVAGMFLNILFALNPPPIPDNYPGWLLSVFPFWSVAFLEKGPAGWLQGWSIAPAIVLWHHVTMLMRPGELNPWRWTRIGIGYILAAAAIYLQSYTDLLLTVNPDGDPTYLNTLQAGPMYPFFALALVAFTVFCLINLIRSARAAPTDMPRKQLYLLASATLFAGMVGPISILGSGFEFKMPIVLISIPAAVTILVLGYGVARYSALVEGRTVRRDFWYSAVGVGFVVFIYSVVVWISGFWLEIPTAFLIIIVILAIFSHSLINVGQNVLNMLFMMRKTNEFRVVFQRVSGIVKEQDEFDDNLATALESISSAVRATYGILFRIDADEVSDNILYYRWGRGALNIRIDDLKADDIIKIQSKFISPLEDAALLLPLYGGDEQIGAIVLGPPINGVSYLDSDVSLLYDPCDRLGEAIWRYQREKLFLDKIAELALLSKPKKVAVKISVKTVEQCLRNLADFAYLGDCPLAKLKIVQEQLPVGEQITYIETGKSVHEVLVNALYKLRPSDESPREPIPRVWYPFIILSDAYLEEQLNRDIMARLYISEGTFNRTRRSAIRTLTRILSEMESSLN